LAENNPQLVRFLEHYKNAGDKKKYSAACYIVENMQDEYFYDGSGKRVNDVDVVIADSLIMSLEYSFGLLESSPYLSDVPFDDFCKYILPYRVANEPLTYYWKWDCRKRLSDFIYSGDVEADSDIINRNIHLQMHPDNYVLPLKSYGDLLASGFGTCDDRAILSVMMLRSVGIMSAFEYIPFWGSTNNGHSFASVIYPNGNIIPLLNSDEQGKEFSFERKTPKIYRKTFDGDGKIDVTSQHEVGCCDVEIDATSLAVFSPNGWIPVAYDSFGCFGNIGIGVDKNGNQSKEAESLGDGIVYMPMMSEGGTMLPCSEPVIVSRCGVTAIRPNLSEKESVTLTRKFPLNTRIVQFAKNMRLGLFEGANRVDFSDAEILYAIKDTPESNVQLVSIYSDIPYRYVRYRRPLGTFSIAEFALYGKNGERIHFTPICDESIDGDDMMKIFDGDPLSYFEVNGAMDLWVGADLGTACAIGGIAFAPRNDDNSVFRGHVYELFYWDREWTSLGKKVSAGNSICFDNVPSGALLWLRDLTKGKEERPFTYSHGKQIWW
jgi:hypothetical protein